MPNVVKNVLFYYNLPIAFYWFCLGNYSYFTPEYTNTLCFMMDWCCVGICALSGMHFAFASIQNTKGYFVPLFSIAAASSAMFLSYQFSVFSVVPLGAIVAQSLLSENISAGNNKIPHYVYTMRVQHSFAMVLAATVIGFSTYQAYNFKQESKMMFQELQSKIEKEKDFYRQEDIEQLNKLSNPTL